MSDFKIPFYDADIDKWQNCRVVKKTVKMNTTSQIFNIPEKVGFSNADSFAVINGGANTTIDLQFHPMGRNSFKITAASAVTNLEIKVLLIGY